MADPVLPAGSTNTQGLAPWAGDYITDYLGKAKALANTKYEKFPGAVSAGPSALQNQAFQGIGSLTVPGSIGQAAGTAGDIASKAQNMNYAPTQFTNQFNAPAQSAATNFTNQFQAPDQYQNTAFTSGTFGGQQAQQYMNPYLQQSLSPQLEEARRQSDITAQQNNANMTRAGAFGGGRQAILTAENQRNLGSNLANITGKGYDTAYTNAMSQFNQDQARNMQAQQASEQSKQFGAQQGMTAAQLMAQYGMSAQQAQEAARQFNQGQAMTGAQSAAQYGQAAQTASEQSRQFGAQQGLAGLNTALSAAQAQGNLGSLQNQTNLANISAQLQAGGQQRAIDSEDIAARQAAFNQEKQYDFQKVQFMRDMIAGLPTGQVSNNAASLTGMGAFLSSLGGGAAAANALGYKDVGELLRGLGLDLGPVKP